MVIKFSKTSKKFIAVFVALIFLFQTFAFSAFAEKQYGTEIEIDMSDNPDTVVSKNAVFVNTDGTAIKSDDEYSNVLVNTKGDKVTAECSFGDGTDAYRFGGWLNEENIVVSTDNPFTFENGIYEKLTPQIISRNVLESASSFESLCSLNNKSNIKTKAVPSGYYFNNKGSVCYTGEPPTGHTWGEFSNFSPPMYEKSNESYVLRSDLTDEMKKGAYMGDNYFSILAVNAPYSLTYYTSYDSKISTNPKSNVVVYPHSGNAMVAVNTYFRSAIKELKGLKENTDYTLSVWLYAQNDISYFNWAAVTTNYTGICSGSMFSYSNDCEVLGASTFTENFGEWTQVKINFNSGNNTTAYFHLQLSSAHALSGGNEGFCFLDDLTVCEYENEMITAKYLSDNELYTPQGIAEYKDSAIQMNYSGEGISFNADCAGTVTAYFDVQVSNPKWYIGFHSYVDGVQADDIIFDKTGNYNIVLAKGLASGEHTFKIERIQEFNLGKVLFKGLTLNGKIISPPEKKTKYI